MAYWFMRKLAVVVVMVCLAVMTGPFGTYEELTFAQRVFYWITAFLGIGFFMEVSIVMALSHPGLRKFGHYTRLFAATLFAAFPGTIIILVLEAILREVVPTLTFGATIWLFVSAVGSVMSVIEYPRGAFVPLQNSGARPEAENAGKAADPGSSFFRRLEPAIGRRLISLSIEDHYLKVVTYGGTQSLLMRMSDAVAELQGYPGMQVHRSHWVSLNAIVELNRRGNKWMILLSNGEQIPASREKAPALRALIDKRQTKSA